METVDDEFTDAAIDFILDPAFNTYANLGTFYLHKGDFENGITYIRKALEVKPDSQEAKTGLSFIALDEGEAEDCSGASERQVSGADGEQGGAVRDLDAHRAQRGPPAGGRAR